MKDSIADQSQDENNEVYSLIIVATRFLIS